MRKIIVSIHSTFNGIVTGPAADKTNFVTWAQAGIKDVSEALLKTLDTVDTILLGRGTYEDLSTKWPFAKDWLDASEVNLRIAEKVNSAPKFVVAGHDKVTGLKWGEFSAPTQLSGNIEEQIRTLKDRDGGDIITFGSPKLVQSLTNADLVDEYHVFVHPVIVGEGEHLFDKLNGRKDFRLLSAATFEHGAILVKYQLVKPN